MNRRQFLRTLRLGAAAAVVAPVAGALAGDVGWWNVEQTPVALVYRDSDGYTSRFPVKDLDIKIGKSVSRNRMPFVEVKADTRKLKKWLQGILEAKKEHWSNDRKGRLMRTERGA